MNKSIKLSLGFVLLLLSTQVVGQDSVNVARAIEKAKLFTISKFGIGTMEDVMIDCQKDVKDSILFIDSNFLFIELFWMGVSKSYCKEHLLHKSSYGCRKEIIYSFNSHYYYRISGFESTDFLEFQNELRHTIGFYEIKLGDVSTNYNCLADKFYRKRVSKRSLNKCNIPCGSVYETMKIW